MSELLAFAVSLGGGVALVKLIFPDDEIQKGLFAGGLIFLLYISLSTAHLMSAVASRVSGCQLISAPQNAKLVDDGTQFTTEGVVWIGLIADANSKLTITLSFPANVRARWKALEAHKMWARSGTSQSGGDRYELRLATTSILTPLGQFVLQRDKKAEADQESIELEATGSNPSGAALSAEMRIGVFLEEPPESFLKPV